MGEDGYVLEGGYMGDRGFAEGEEDGPPNDV